MSTHDNTINRDSQAYWNKRATTFTRDATSDYERWLMDLLALTEGEEVLDMGCATGTLAVPLARAGHRVHGCDFAEAMLAILDERAAAEHLPITSHLLAWEDDWEAAGLGTDSVDVAFASRSLMAEAVGPFVAKLDSAARSRAAVVVPDSLLPSRDPRLPGAHSQTPTRRPRRNPRTGCHGPDPGRREDPDLPPDAFFFLRRGPLGPSSPGRPRAVHRTRAATLRRLLGPAHRAPGSRIPVWGDVADVGPRLRVARHVGVQRLAHQREPVGLTQPRPRPCFNRRRGDACAP